MKYRGVFHAHSKHSYDGETPLPELCAVLRQRGYHFLLLTEHDDKLDAATYAKIVAECRALSGPEFLVVPGLEVRCWRTEREQWHIAAVGVERWIERGPIPEVVARIQAAGGLAIFLHPHKYADEVDPAALAIFDAVEMWNGKEDGAYAPPRKTLQLARAVARTAHRPVVVGHDLHSANEQFPLALEVEAPALEARDILERIRAGDFVLRARGMRMSPRTGPSAGQMFSLALWRGAYVAYAKLVRGPGVRGVVRAAGSVGVRRAREKPGNSPNTPSTH